MKYRLISILTLFCLIWLSGFSPVWAQETEAETNDSPPQASAKPTPPKKKKKERKTPSHVYQHSEQVVREIKLIREALGKNERPRDPGVQSDKNPLHSFGKSLEVLEKVARLQTSVGLSSAEIPPWPQKQVRANDVFDSISLILAEILKLKAHYGITGTIEEPRFRFGKSSSDVYENLWRASYLLDSMTAPWTPNHVYRNTQYILSELRLIAEAEEITLTDSDLPMVAQTTVPKDVLIELFKNLYRMAKYQRKLGLRPLRPPFFPSGEITPSDPYDATFMLLAEITRIKNRLRIKNPLPSIALPDDKIPANVFAQALQIGSYLSQMSEQTEE